MIRRCEKCGANFVSTSPSGQRSYSGTLRVRSANALTCSEVCAGERRKADAQHYHLEHRGERCARARAWNHDNPERVEKNKCRHRMRMRAAEMLLEKLVGRDRVKQELREIYPI